MFRSVLIMIALSASHVVGLKVALGREGVWAAPDLAAVSGMLQGILKLHLTPENRKLAEKVAQDVKEDIAAVVNNKNLTRQAKREKVGQAIKEIGELEQQLSKKPNMTALNAKIEHETKMIEEKKALLLKDEKMLKVMTLKKDLLEKKLKLNKMIEAKMQKQQSKQGLAQEAKAQGELVKKLETVAANMKNVKASGEALAAFKGRSKSLSEEIATMEKEEKQRSSELASMSKVQLAGKGLTKEELTQGEKMVKKLDKEGHRKYEKARALKKSQLAEVDAVIRSIEKGDASGLQQALNKMKAQVKALDAKTGGFLY